MLVLRALVGGAALLGIAPDTLAERAGIDAELLAPALLADPDARGAAS